MVLRIFWNFGVGAIHHAVTKTSAKAGGGVLYPIVWRGRTGFLDCFVNQQLNHASYLSTMELARWHYAGVIGLLPLYVRKRMVFLAAANAIRYRHPIPPFTTYEIQTRIIHWDDEWMYFLQQFVSPSSGLVYAEGLCRATVKVGRTRVSMREIYRKATGLDVEHYEKNVPPAVEEFLKWDAACRENMETAEAQAAALVTAKKPVRDLWGKLTLTWNSPFRKLE